MKIELKQITIAEIFENYKDDREGGVTGFNNKLNIRPPYQREFVYNEQKRNEVINTIINGFPLNTMYWSKNEDGTYEMLDGQQRTISFCQYLNNDFSFKYNGSPLYFENLPNDIKEKIKNYKVMIYICQGDDSEKLDWFKVINIAGEKLTNQELLNAIYTGPWLSDAKKRFSKTNCPAKKLADNYIKANYIRQECLELAIKWISKDNIPTYMNDHKNDHNSLALWTYFENVINWVIKTFPNKRKEMKSVEWGPLYDIYHGTIFDLKKLECRIIELMQDREVTKKPGIYEFVLFEATNTNQIDIDKKSRVLSLRIFDDTDKRQAYEKQKGICPICKKHFELNEMEADHKIPWSKGGKTILENCQMLCSSCNRDKSGK